MHVNLTRGFGQSRRRNLTKSVLISYGENRRVLQDPVDVERVHLLEFYSTEFRDLIPQPYACVLTLQKKEETWGGIFVDYTERAIEDKDIFQLVAVTMVGPIYIVVMLIL